MGAPRPIRRCFRCGELLHADRPTTTQQTINLTHEEDRRYRVKCHKCGQYIEFNARSYEEAFELYNEMFNGNVLYPIEDLTVDDWFVLGHRVPICEPPDVITVIGTDYDEKKYTHFSYLPEPRWIEVDGQIVEYAHWERGDK